MVAQPHHTATACRDSVVLFVDDDAGVRASFKRLSDTVMITADVADPPNDALDRLRANPGEYSVVISDYWMPGMDGAALLAKANDLAPWATRILLSGALDVPRVVQAVNAGGIYQVIAKPWDNGDLVSVI